MNRSTFNRPFPFEKGRASSAKPVQNRKSSLKSETTPNISTSSYPSQKSQMDDNESTATTSSSNEQIEYLTRLNVFTCTYEDMKEIRELFDDHTQMTYNIDDPFFPIHRCYSSLKLTTSQNKIVGVLCLGEFPNVPGLPQVGWSHWAAKLYNIKDLSSYNCVWIHFVAFDQNYKEHFLYPMLNYLFHEMLKKLFALVVIPAGCHNKVPYLDGVSSVVLPQGYTDPSKVQTIRLCVRQDFITQYKVRRAVEEDNDDLVPLIHEFSPRFVELYGEYYVAEIITRHPEAGRKIIVAEHEGEAVSVLCLNPKVNYEQLNECFNLHLFTGLYKTETARQVPKPKTKPPTEPKPPPSKQKKSTTSNQRKKSKSLSRAYYDFGSFAPSSFDIDSQEEASMTVEERGPTFSILDDIDNLTREHSSGSMLISFYRSQFSEIEFPEESITESSSISTSSESPFTGVENAFAIEILAAQTKHQPSLSLLIISCFECYQDRDYCLLMLPHDADYSPILKYFVRVQPRLCAQHPHELYVCHRGQLTPLRVEIAYDTDAERVYNFIKLLKYPGQIKANYEKGISGKENIITFLALSGMNYKVPVGLAQVSKVNDLQSIKMKYAISQRSDIRWDSDFSFGYLVSNCLSPLFKRHSRFFLREIHRKTDFQTIFYALNRHDVTDYRIRPLAFSMLDMFLVPPRKVRISVRKSVNDYREEPYALFMSQPSFMSKPCINVFNAIYDSGLVFDGRLVIDPDCHTNDPFIYAAGPLTKYSRKLWADHLVHKHFNSEEIGSLNTKNWCSCGGSMKLHSTI